MASKRESQYYIYGILRIKSIDDDVQKMNKCHLKSKPVLCKVNNRFCFLKFAYYYMRNWSSDDLVQFRIQIGDITTQTA